MTLAGSGDAVSPKRSFYDEAASKHGACPPSSPRILSVGLIVCVLLFYGFWGHSQTAVLVKNPNATFDHLMGMLKQQNAILAQYDSKLELILENSKKPLLPVPLSPTATDIALAQVPYVTMGAPDAKGTLLYSIINVNSGALNMAAKFAVMSTDKFVGATFRSGQWWEDTIIAQILAEFGQHPAKNCNVLDLGVNLGAHTVAYGMYLLKQGSRYTERCTVFGFEPQPGVFLAAVTNVGLNGLGNVQLFNAATVHADGQSVTMGAKEDTGATISFTDGSLPVNFGGLSLGSGGVVAKGLKIDSLGFERVGLIKADIQGSEPMAFWGARELIKRDKPLIFYETGFANAIQMQEIVNGIKPGPVPAEVSSFDLWAFCQPLGYTMKTFGADRLLVPPR